MSRASSLAIARAVQNTGCRRVCKRGVREAIASPCMENIFYSTKMSSLLCPRLSLLRGSIEFLKLRCGDKREFGKRRKSITLPVLPTYLLNVAQVAKKLKKRKGVKFQVGVLMQQAITEGDVQEMRELMNDNGNKVVEEREPSGLPPVMRAVFEGQPQCLNLLVEAGADLTARDQEGWTALHVAAAMDDMEAAQYIIGACNESLTEVRNIDGERPIDLSESVEMAKLLLHANLISVSCRLENATLKCDSHENESAVLRLVHDHFEKNANCSALDAVLETSTCYDTLLHLAASKNYPRLAKYILRHKIVDTEVRDRRGWTPLHTAAYYNCLDTVLLLLEYGASTHSLTNSFDKAKNLTEHELILAVLEEEETLDYV